MLEVTFFVSAFVRLLTLIVGKKHDTVIAVAPSFNVGLLGLFYKLMRGAKLIYHIQDLQIEAAKELNIIHSKLLMDLLFALEKYILKHADITSTISKAMLMRVQKKSRRPAVLFPNWTDTSHIFPIRDGGFLKAEFGFNETDKIVLYSGAIGEKQGLESILFTALVHRDNAALKFVICGSGPYKQNLENLAGRLGLTNVIFLPLQPPGRFNHFLNSADIHLVIQRTGASDLVMPSKLGPILAAGGLALITANRGTSLYDLAHDHDVGYIINAEDQEALNDAVRKLLTGDFKYLQHNARNYALNFLSIDKVMTGFESAITQSLAKGKTKYHVQIPELVDDVSL